LVKSKITRIRYKEQNLVKRDRCMAYMANLSSNQHLTVVNRGMQTVITVTSSSPGQQQNQSISLTTGNWIKPPELFKTRSGFILQLNSDRGQRFVLIQANSISTIAAPVLDNAIKIDLENEAMPDIEWPQKFLKLL
jgi:hypothetical protein